MPDKRRILLVDDEPGIVKMVGRRLEAEGYAVAVAMDGEEALQKGLEGDHELVILDIMLPKINGYEVCRQLKAARPDVPVVMFTAMAQQKDRKLGFESGADDYVCKPFRTDDLLAKIREWLKQ